MKLYSTFKIYIYIDTTQLGHTNFYNSENLITVFIEFSLLFYQ